MNDTPTVNSEPSQLAMNIVYRYFQQPFDGDPETLARIVDEVMNGESANSEPTVEEALKELREMFPDEGWLEARETRRLANGRVGGFAEVVVGYDPFRGENLTNVMAQVRNWKQEQS